MRRKQYGAWQTIMSRFETYEKVSNRLSIGILILAGVAAAGVASSWWAISQKPEVKYFLARENGMISEIVPVDQPYLDDNEVLRFATSAITSAMTFDFVNYRSSMSRAAKYFDRPDGWNKFLKAMKDSGMLEYVKERRLISSTVANEAVIVKRGQDAKGYYNWTVEVPITVTYQTSSEKTSRNHKAIMELSRVEAWKSPDNIGVTNIIVQ